MVGFNNISALVAQGNIGKASTSASASISRLSSGNRIAIAADDVAGLSVGTALRTQVSTLKQALANAGQGTSLLQVADGALSQLVDIVTRQKAIATQASSGQLDDTARGYLDQEFQALAAQVNQIASSTNFNGVKLLNGGLGTTVTQANTDALAAGLTNAATQSTAATAANTTTAAQAFFGFTTGAATGGASAAGFANAGALNFTDSSGTTLANGAYDSINGALYGKFENFKLTNVVYNATAADASATLTATINGVSFSGSITGASTNALLNNGSSYIKIGLGAATNAAAAVVALTNAGTVQNAEAGLNFAFSNTYIGRTSSITGVDFSGTKLQGAIGAGATGVAMARLYSTNAVISDFKYEGNLGVADTSRITVNINGQSFAATGVKDALAAGTIAFQSQDGQLLKLDLTGLPANSFTNIRTNVGEQTALIDALNIGFSKAGSGLSFAVGASQADTIKVSLSSVSTSSIYNGQSLDVSTAASSQAAAPAIDKALQLLTAARATVGAFESRFAFTSANLQTSIQNQDAARGVLLDTDVSAESTAFSTAQVTLQAGIAVLAQANQLPQSLLKLIQ
jgi:flagellin